MAEKNEIVVRVALREGRGKNDSRRARKMGTVPITIYGGEGDTIAGLAPLRELAAILRSDSGFNTIFTIEVEGVGPSEVMFRERQIDPVRGRLIHADFKRLVAGQMIEVTVPLRLVGVPIGVTEGAGVLEQIIREIEIRCEPREIPEEIAIDVSGLGVHDTLHISDIPANEKIEILKAADQVIATVGIVKEEVVVVAPVEGEEPAEPEVIGKGKKEDEGETAGDEEKEKEKK